MALSSSSSSKFDLFSIVFTQHRIILKIFFSCKTISFVIFPWHENHLIIFNLYYFDLRVIWWVKKCLGKSPTWFLTYETKSQFRFSQFIFRLYFHAGTRAFGWKKQNKTNYQCLVNLVVGLLFIFIFLNFLTCVILALRVQFVPALTLLERISRGCDIQKCYFQCPFSSNLD